MFESWVPDICVYHFPCDDGFACAWIARRKWRDIVTFGTNYGLPFPDVDITGRNVLIADFSYKPDVLRELGAKAKSIVILDHHKTALADLLEFQPCAQERGNITAHFDMDHSGAMMTWDFCFPGKPAPEMLRYIEDRDLWRFNLKETRSFSLYLRSHPYDFEVWTDVANRLWRMPNAILGEAAAIERFYDRKLAEMLPTATWKNIGQWNVPVAHAPYAFASDLAHELLKAHAHAPFAAVAVDAYGGRTYSLRSEDSRQDVSEVARQFGGGGHRNASGFRVPI